MSPVAVGPGIPPQGLVRTCDQTIISNECVKTTISSVDVRTFAGSQP